MATVGISLKAVLHCLYGACVRCRSRTAATTARWSFLDGDGNLGVYANLRLLGIVWYFAERTALTVDVFDLALPTPQLRGWPVLQAQHRISVGRSF
jgi:hypothetical protein